MAYLTARPGINSLFGAYNILQDQTNITYADPGATNASIYDYVLRGKDGIQNKIKKSGDTVEALTAPTEFLAKKRTNLEAIAAELDLEFKKVFRKQLNRNLPIKEVRANTKKEIDALYDKLMKIHNEDYPHELVSRIVKKLTGGN